MNYAIIENEKVTNTIVADEEFATLIGAIYFGNLPIRIGDSFINNKFVQDVEEIDQEGHTVIKHYEYDIPAKPTPVIEPTPLEQAQTEIETNSVIADYTFTMLKATLDIANEKINSLQAEITALKGV